MLEVVDLEEDFDVFNRTNFVEFFSVNSRPLPSAQVSSIQETIDVLEAMDLQQKKTSLLELLESHAGGTTPKVVVNPRPPTPLPSRTSHTEPLEKKRKKDKKGKETSEEGKIQPTKDQEPLKGAKAAKGP